jgi:hypothetical protein
MQTAQKADSHTGGPLGGRRFGSRRKTGCGLISRIVYIQAAGYGVKYTADGIVAERTDMYV